MKLKMYNYNKMHNIIIDKCDYKKIKIYKWYIVKAGTKHKRYYAVTSCGNKYKKTTLYMHQIIIGKAPKGMVIDHINRNTLDNRKCNLRHTTQRINSINSKVYGQTGFKYINKTKITKYGQSYEARLWNGSKNIFLAHGYNAKELYNNFIVPEYKKIYGQEPVNERSL